MKNLIAVSLLLSISLSQSQNFNFQRTWATYYGNENIKMIDNAIDSQGNIYIVGNVVENEFVTPFIFATVGAYQTSYSGGESDGFILKMNPDGQIVWGSYFGGENADGINGITIDKQDKIFIIGGTYSTSGIASPDAYQQNLNGVSDTFIASFSADGILNWSTYYGGSGSESSGISDLGSDIKFDDVDAIYITSNTDGPGMGTVGTFQPEKSDSKYYLAKFTKLGTRIWSTYYGHNGSSIRAIEVSTTGLYVSGPSNDAPPLYVPSTYFATADCHQPTEGSFADAYLSKFSLNGERLWSTYYGGESHENTYRNSITCVNGAIYFSGTSSSSTNIATSQSFQEASNQNGETSFLAKFSDSGERLWGTYCGLNIAAQTNLVGTGVNADDNGDVYLCGVANHLDHIATPDGFQPTSTGNNNFVVKFNPAGEREWGTYYGGNYSESACFIQFHNDSFYLFGTTNSDIGIATPGSLQPNYFNTQEGNNGINTYIAKFDPIPLATNNFQSDNAVIYPNPNDGNFTIALKTVSPNFAVSIYNALGQMVYNKNTEDGSVQTDHLASGIYFIKIKAGSTEYKTQKMVIK